MIRAFIADDEVLALERARSLLSRFEDVEIVGTATSGRLAFERIVQLAPDVVFLDIEMPGLDGFGIVEELARADSVNPLVMFITAFPQFAALAFDTGAIDFLTKPLRQSRLDMSMQRLRRALADRTAGERLRELSGQLETLRRERGGRQLWVLSRGQSVRLDLDEIERVEGEGEYVRLFLAGASYLHRDSVSRMAERLDQNRFVRIHRSHIVNRRRIVAVRRRATGGYQVVVADGTLVPVGRSYRGVIRTILAATEGL